MNREASILYAKQYVENLLSFYGINTEVYATAEGDMIELSVPASYLSSLLIGKNGATLNSLQYLVRATLKLKNADLTRVNLDVADYKKRRNDSLAKQAEEWAKQVIETGETMALKPMNPADRYTIHKALIDYGQIDTASEGEGKERHIVLRLKVED